MRHRPPLIPFFSVGMETKMMSIRCLGTKRNLLPHARFQVAPALVGLGLVVLCSGASGQQSIDVFTVVPLVAEPGDTVTITGQGLQGSPDDYFAWLRTADAAIVLETVTTGSNNGIENLETVLETAAVAGAGQLEVWRGRTHAMPDLTVWSQGRLLTGSDTRLFIAEAVASGPSLTVVNPSPETLDGPFDGEWISVDLAESSPSQIAYIRLTVIIESEKGCNQASAAPFRSPAGVSPRPSADDTSAASRRARGRAVAPTSAATSDATLGPSWAAQTMLRPDAAFADAEELAAALATWLNEQFGPLGLLASAEGSVVTICNVGCLRFASAALSIVRGGASGPAVH